MDVAAHQVTRYKGSLVYERDSHHEYHEGVNMGWDKPVEGNQSYDEDNNEDKDKEQNVVLIGIDQAGAQNSEERQQNSQHVGVKLRPETWLYSFLVVLR